MMAWRWRYWIERNNQPWSCSKTKSCFPKKKRFQWFLREELHPYSSCSRRLLSAKRPPTPKEKQFFACQTLNERCCLHSTIDNKIGGGYVFIVLVAWIWDFLIACINSIFQSSIFLSFGHLVPWLYKDNIILSQNMLNNKGKPDGGKRNRAVWSLCPASA